MHQTIYGVLNLNENLEIDFNGDYQPLCTYSHAGTLFSIGAQFEGTKVTDENNVIGFLITKMTLKMYCFYGSATIGLVGDGEDQGVFEFNEDPEDEEHLLTVNVQSYNTNGLENWPKPESSWSLFPEGYFLKQGNILRTAINIVPHILPDTDKSAQDYPFLDSYSYIRNGEIIEDKNKFISQIEYLESGFNLHKQEFEQLQSIMERITDEELKRELEIMANKKPILDEKWTIDPLQNYFMKGRDRNCYQRDVKIVVN